MREKEKKSVDDETLRIIEKILDCNKEAQELF